MLVYGFYPPQTQQGERFRWMTKHGALLMRTRRHTSRLAMDYMVALRGTQVVVEVRPLDDRKPVWRGTLTSLEQPLSWARAELPVRVHAGTYVVALSVSQAGRPSDGSTLGLGLAGLELT